MIFRLSVRQGSLILICSELNKQYNIFYLQIYFKSPLRSQYLSYFIVFRRIYLFIVGKFSPQILTSVPIGCEEKSNEMVVLSCFLPQNTPLSVYWHEEFSNGSSVLLWEGDYISRLDPYNFKYQDRTYNISVTKGDNYKCTVKSYHLEFMVDKLYLQYGEEYSTNMSDVCVNGKFD